MKSWTGIDNGLDGAICTVLDDGTISTSVMPTFKKGKGREVDVTEILNLIPEGSFVLVEPAQIISAGIKAVASTHFSWGLIKALLVLERIRYEEIRPQKWQKAFWTRPKLPKGTKFDTKAAALAAAKRIFPNERFLKSERCRVAHDGIVDALLIAEFARRSNF